MIGACTVIGMRSPKIAPANSAMPGDIVALPRHDEVTRYAWIREIRDRGLRLSIPKYENEMHTFHEVIL